MREHFGELRSILHQGMNAATWKRLCRFVDMVQYDDDFEAVGLSYIQGILRQWPQDLLTAPSRWLEQRLIEHEVSPGWAMVRAIDCHGQLFGALTLRKIGRELFNTQVNIFRARGLCFTQRDLEALLDDSNCTQLRHLDLTKTPLPLDLMQVVATCEHLKHLERLDVGECKLGKVGVQMICISPFMTSLKSLTLQNDRIGLGALHILLNSSLAPQLRQLDLSDNHIGVRGAKALAQCRSLENLEYLAIKHCNLGIEGMRALMNNPNLPNLKHLSVRRNDISSAGFRAIFESPLMSQLETLDAGYNKIGCDALQDFFKYADAPNLKRMAIHWNPANPIVQHHYDAAEWATFEMQY